MVLIWNHTDKSELKKKKLSDQDLATYLNEIKTEILLAYGVTKLKQVA